MPQYKYRAINEFSRMIRGEMTADNEIDLEVRLREVGMDLIDFKEAKARKSGSRGKVKLKDMLIFCVHMEQLIRAGVPIHECLADVRDATDSAKLRDTTSDILDRVKSGSTLSQAMAEYPRVFSNVFTGLIQAGEKNGNLTESFTHMGEHLKWTEDLRRKVKKAVTYPAILLVVMSGVITILMTFVVPKMVKFIVDQGFEIPLHTRALIATSSAFEHYWFLIFGVPIGFAMLVAGFYRASSNFAYKWDSWMLRMPAIGKVIQKINIARFVHFFSVMYQSGIDIPEALKAAKSVVGNLVLKESIDMAHRGVNEGSSLTNSLRVSNQFPNLVVRMFKIGEDSGNMNEALDNVSFFYTREVNDSVDKFIALIQPTLTVVLGLLIFWVIAAVFGPIYESFQNMKF